MESALVLAWWCVGPEVCVEGRLGGFVLFCGVEPGADDGGVGGCLVPLCCGCVGTVAGRLESGEALVEAAVLQSVIVVELAKGVGGDGGGTRLVKSIASDDWDVVRWAVGECLGVLLW